MAPQQIFPYFIACVEVIAGLVYAYYGNYRLAMVWVCVGVGNFAFAGVKG